MKKYLLFEEGLIFAKLSRHNACYIVKEDESLRDIAWKYYRDEELWQVIMDYNGFTKPEQIYEGIVLEIPPIF